MPIATINAAEALPRSHFFLSFAHGRSIRTIRIRAGLARVMVGLFGLLILWTIGSALYLALHDDLVASLMAREAAAQYAYEDRIAALRSQVEREASLKLVGETTLEGRLKELGQRASSLETRASLLADMAARTGLRRSGTASVAPLSHAPVAAPDLDNPTDATPTGTIGTVRKPQVEGAADPMERGSSYAVRLAGVEERLEHVDAGQLRRLGLLGDAAHRRADALRTAILSAGLSLGRVAAASPTSDAGGPFVPLDPALLRSSFGQALEAMQGEITTAASLTRALPHIPLARPLDGALEVTSPFGARLDPFLGRPAMHTGVDLREGYGTDVRATATGRIVTAGPVGGYGTMIEIDHGHGLATRYAHLSSVAVSPGQVVEKGAVIGEVGATGRATGPHLHYETRIDGEPVDPERFLIAGAKLAAAEAGL